MTLRKVRWGVLSTAQIGTNHVIPDMQKGEYSTIIAIASRDAAGGARTISAMSVDDMSRPGMVAKMLGRLSSGERVTFTDRDVVGPEIRFSMEKVGEAYVIRDDQDCATASASTFAEAWRRRPTPGAAQ